MQVADYLISSGRCAQLDIEVGMCEQDTRIEEVVLRAVQSIWRNGPYIGGHLAFLFQIEF